MTATATTERTDVRARGRFGALRSALDADLARMPAFLLLALAYVASRAPFIDNGYGTKPDAWRIALTDYWLWDHGELYPSRLPGYPVPELAYATVIKGGWVATNSLTVAVSLLGVWFFACIVRKLKLPAPALLVAGYAFNPLLWINSMNTMDYTWALTFILGAYYFVLIDRTTVAALALGLAVGSRIPSASFIVPYSFLLWRSGRRGQIPMFAATVAAIAAVAFAPYLWTYHLRFFNFYDAKIGYRDVFRLLTKDALGLAGSAALAVACLLSWRRLARLPGDAIRDANVGVWAIAIVLVSGTFFRLPHEAAYLMPLFPFAYLLIGRYLHPVALAAAVVVIVGAGFVDFTTATHEVTLGELRHMRIGQGMLLSNRDTQNAQLAYARDIDNTPFPEGSVVMIGFVYPQFAVLNRDRLDLGILEKDRSSISQLTDKGRAVDTAAAVTYVWLLDYADFQRFQALGTQSYYTPDAGRSVAALYNFRPGLFGAQVIESGRAPGGGADTAGRNQR
jgi:hypothetical protein